ncbi:hypothetical protein NFI96_025922 [Prochilodus magdalenae]|nr:hypothetical protein NFI96_025922 [Prochilodus magdalenae]
MTRCHSESLHDSLSCVVQPSDDGAALTGGLMEDTTARWMSVMVVLGQSDRQNRIIFLMFGVLSVFLLILTLTVGIKSGPCEEDWVFYKEKCYFISRQMMKKWEDAEKNCVQRRAHLLVVNDGEELDYISQLVDINTNYWIGLVERGEEGSWTWVDGTDYSKTEHFWDEGQPDDWNVRFNGEDCGQLHAEPAMVRRPWNDADCTLSYKFICEGTPRTH